MPRSVARSQGPCGGVPPKAVALRLLTFNTKDFFPPGGPVTPALFQAKVEHVAQKLLEAQADVVALQEIGPEAALLALAARLKRELPYPYVFAAPPDPRGIRCAVLSRRPFAAAESIAAEAMPFPVFVEGDAPPFGARLWMRRPLVHVRLDEPEGPLHVFVAHFKSRLPAPLRRPTGEVVPSVSAADHAAGLLRSLVWRGAEALFVRSRVDAVLAAEPGASVAVLGDLNDEPKSVALDVLTAAAAGPAAQLHEAADRVLPAARFSLIHQGQPVQLDHILVTGQLFQRLDHARFLSETLRDHGPYGPGTPPTADSDHAAFSPPRLGSS